ncbi:Adhesion G-protein coupled receptor G4 [Holothuria leucospilota]|uniref:Adhesion G-protein coupled receptor G4 n=1 Tax=Holothuria leucospilota TaxID=206669 RepID=A0A9Q1HCA6_HOLLE|nr:Adhesion G-protein coupled receptor G4 [Holothuria leucospilota]
MNEFQSICVSVLGCIMFTVNGQEKIQMIVVNQYPTQRETVVNPIQYYLSDADANATVTFKRLRLATRAQPTRGRTPTGSKDGNLGSTTQDVNGISPTKGSSGPVGAFRYLASMTGRKDTSITTILLHKEAEVLPKDGLITKTVSVEDGRVFIEMETTTKDFINYGYIEWRKGRQLLSQDGYNVTLTNVSEEDGGIYQCRNDWRSSQTVGGMLRLIVRKCRADHWGPPACDGICDNCYNGGVCDDKTGKCICPAGFKGTNCLQESRGRFGYEGEFQCSDLGGSASCQGMMFCLLDPFGCRCASGFKDLTCEEGCPSGTYGANCLQQCHCSGECDRYTGKCKQQCLDGYSGKNCQIPAICKTGYYGDNCLDKCHCYDDSVCNRRTGKCENELCADGYARQGSENCKVLRPSFPSWLMSEEFHRHRLGENVNISCDSLNAKRVWWEYQIGQRRVKVSDDQFLQIWKISFQDQGNYFCIAEGREQVTIESGPQLLYVSNYLQFMLTISTNEDTTASMDNINRTAEEIKSIFKTELVGMHEKASMVVNSESILAYYITKEIIPDRLPTSEVKRNISTVFERARNFVILNRNETIIELHSLSFCSGESIVTAAGPLSFPDTDVNTIASSIQVCLTSGDLHRGSRRCNGDFTQPAVWEYPSLLNCFANAKKSQKSAKLSDYILKIIEDAPLTLRNASYIARDLADMTATSKIHNFDALASALRKVSDVNCSSSVVTSCFVETIDNIMNATLQSNGSIEGQEMSQNASSVLLQSLEHQLENIRNSGQNYTNVKANIAVNIVHVTPSEDPITFASLIKPSGHRNDSEGLKNSTIFTHEFDDLNLTEICASIRLPQEVFRFVSNKTQTDSVPVTFVIHRSGVFFNDKNRQDFKLNTLVISASLPEDIKDLPDGSNVLITLNPLKKNGEQGDKCVYWNFSRYSDGGGWSDEGCVLTNSGSSYFCHCNHLTNFAVLMGIEGDSSNKTLDIISFIGCLVSIISLVVTVGSFLAVKKLRSSRPQQILLNLCLALLGLYTSFLAGIDKPYLGTLCIVFGGLIHYFCLASMAWMTVKAVNMYLLFVKVINTQVDRFMIKAFLFAWGLPMIVVATSIAMSKTSYSHPNYCFPKHSSYVFYAAVLGIIGALVVVNSVIFALICWRLSCSGRAPSSNRSKTRHLRSRLQNAVAISVLLGLTWSFGFLSFGNMRLIFNALFCICNSLQGFAIFVLFCVRQKLIRHTWRRWLHIPSSKRQSSISLKVKSQQRTTVTEDKITSSLDVLKERSQMNF